MPDSIPLHIVLHQPEIPQNTGNIARTCVALGAKLWLVRPLGFQLTEKRLRRAGLDYWPHLQYEVLDDWQGLGRRVPDVRTWFFSKRGRCQYTDVHYQPGDALVFGSETTGLPSTLLDQHPQQVLRIPIRPQVRSLNLSNAVAIAGYEVLRQWQGAGMWQEPV